MTTEQEQNNTVHQATILKDLSDIKSSLAVNTSETSNIKSNISEIKNDIKDIKNDYPTRRELTEGLEAVREEMAPLKKFIYALIGVICLAMIGAIINLVLMKK